MGQRDEAIAQFRTAVQLKPDYADAWFGLGLLLALQGDYAEAVAMLRRGHEMGSKKPGWLYPSAAKLAEAERMLALSKRLPAVLVGKDKPHDNAERLTLAQMGYNGKHFAGAARLWGEAIKVDPKIVEDRRAQHRYNAACAAALAGCGKGKDEPAPDDKAKCKLRQQALDWLNAELVIWDKLLARDGKAKPIVLATLQHWKVDPDLAGLRDTSELAKLPEKEKKSALALWAEVDKLLARAGERGKP
jgi:serine/threonine-protein kinase